MAGRPPSSCRRDVGFALIIVLWTLVLIGFIVVHLTASGRTEIRIASNLAANSIAEAAADGAIFEAIFNLSDPRPDRRWPVDGIARELSADTRRVIVRVEDEASWINPSSASPEFLDALLRVTGSDPESAHRLAVAISEWVGSATSPRPQNAILAEYRAAGLDYGPPGGGPLESLDELDRVLGMTPATLAAIRSHLTLFGSQEPNPATVDPIVAAALALLAQGGPAALLANEAPQDLLTVRITALAAGPGNARVIRFAVVRTGATLQRGYTVLAWGSSAETDPLFATPVASLTR